jgi:hypothetical protein
VAIKRVMRECEWVTLKVIIDRIPRTGRDDGRPETETAWAMCPKSEDATVVWTEEMAWAFGVARKLLQNDSIAARMAFKESYVAELAKARQERRQVRWEVSLGWDKGGRVAPLVDAVLEGRITAERAKALLGEQADELGKALPRGGHMALPPGPVDDVTAKAVSLMPDGIAKAFAALAKRKAMPMATEEDTSGA